MIACNMWADPIKSQCLLPIAVTHNSNPNRLDGNVTPAISPNATT